MATVSHEGPTLVWDDRFTEYDFGPEHPFQSGYRALAAHLFAATSRAAGRSFRTVDHVEVAPESELTRFHRPAYLERVRVAGQADRPGALDRGDTPAFPGCFESAGRIVGGALAALEGARAGPTRRAFHPAGGLHHAAPSAASGFCIFNDLGVLLRRALDGPDRFARAAYVDIDAHHGDGVMYGFYDDGRLLDIDFHQDGRTLFPGTGSPEETGSGDGAGKKVNVPMVPGAGDESFRPLFSRLVPPLLDDHRPELIVLQHGMDGHRDDPLAQLALGRPSYFTALTTLRDWASAHGVPFVVAGGGGYRPENVARGLARAGILLAEPPLDPPETDPIPDAVCREWRTVAPDPPPMDWAEPTVSASSTPPARVDRLLGVLSERLGRPF